MPKRRPKRTFFIIVTLLVTGISILLWRFGLSILYAYLIGINAVTMLAYAYDKRQAIANGGRVPEVVLHVTALAGGSIGALLGQGLFRHKTRKLKFKLVFLAVLIAQLLAAGGYWYFTIRTS